MALTAISLLCFAALLPFPGLGLPADSGKLEQVPVRVTVINDFTNEQVSYSTTVVEEGLMFGALNQLQSSNDDFKFTYGTDKSFGLYLKSVNGLVGSDVDQTYWEILSEKSGVITRVKAGIGCYQPERDENMILRFTTWAKK
ncbi:Transcobalamin-1 precursor [Labeo rohita]|uniref:Transcobalamin-1 n=1 Tax=Labeo rohita TaxID=84645 RepID=A0A498LYB2_LABRO|nr:transcobalamin beta a [Labeo rohita]RXN10385.1 Transcobalamin-1 precursor [Labeo rohita]